HRGALLALPDDPAGLGRDRVDRADAVLARRDQVAAPDPVEVVEARLARGRRHVHAGVLLQVRHLHVERAIGARLIVLAAGDRGTDEDLLTDAREQPVRVDRRRAGLDVDVGDHVLLDGRARPEELPGLAVERVDEAGLAGNAGDDLVRLPGS